MTPYWRFARTSNLRGRLSTTIGTLVILVVLAVLLAVFQRVAILRHGESLGLSQSLALWSRFKEPI